MSVATKRDYYEVLGVSRTADEREIRRSYRRIAMEYHPDRNQSPDAVVIFKEAAEAYEVLSDPDKRQRYDRFGHAGLNGAAMHDFSGMGVEDIFSIFGDLFGEGFGGRRRGGRAVERGVDIQTVIEVSLQEVATGVEKTLRFERDDLCEACDGSGAESGSTPRTCETCGGYGQVERQASAGFFVTRTIVDCPACDGRGRRIDDPCRKCRGSGRQRRERVLTVKVPPGIHDGQRLRHQNEGEPSQQGKVRGDLYCVVRVKPHAFLERDGDHLICRFPIGFSLAALGGNVEIPTLDGRTPLQVPPGTQHGDVFRIKDKGLPNLRSGRRGEEIVQVLIEVPKRMTSEQQELLRKFAATENHDVLPQTKSFFERVKEYFTGADDGDDED